MDVERLEQLVGDFHDGTVATHFVDSTEPSPLAHEILSGRPYTFLDDAPLEERRTRAVKLRRGLPVEARELARLDPEAIARVREQAQPEPRDPDELHDLLLQSVVLRPEWSWRRHLEALVEAGRATIASLGLESVWVATERRGAVAVAWDGARFTPDLDLPQELRVEPALEPEEVVADALRGHLDQCGPIDAPGLATRLVLPLPRVEAGLTQLEAEGFVLRGAFEDGRGDVQWCARRLLTRIHGYTQDRLRREIQPVSARDFMRFLLRWQHVAPGTRREGRAGALAAIEQLQGFEVAAGSWETDVLPARIDGYRPEQLDALCLSGAVAWGRLSLRPGDREAGSAVASRGGLAPSRATPVSLLIRDDVSWLLRTQRGDTLPTEPGPGAALDVLAALRDRGALFHGELVTLTGRLPLEVEQGLWELVARGLVAADGFQAVRSLLGSRDRWARRTAQRRMRRGLRRGAKGAASAEGRWAPFPAVVSPAESFDPDALAEAAAEQLLARWGVVFRDLLVRENLGLPWREVLWAMRRMEARGTIRGGRFVTGFVGEQYALPQAVDALRSTRRRARDGEVVRLAASDPLNLVGILTPGPRLSTQRNAFVVYRDGAVVSDVEDAEAPLSRIQQAPPV
jgi:ATP-dependent Lhr-like helicase